MTQVRLYLTIGLLTLILIVSQYHLWFQSTGIRDMLQTKKKLAQQIAINDQLKQRNEELLLQIQNIKESQDAAESRARSELGMIKKNETFYQIVQSDQRKKL